MANNGRDYLVRDTQRGLARIAASTGTHVILNASSEARQDAPISSSADGEFLAMVVDRNVVRILRMPAGSWFADLQSPALATITDLRWDPTGQRVAALTDAGRLLVWQLSGWQHWLAEHRLSQ